jgi:hypothetical protein
VVVALLILSCCGFHVVAAAVDVKWFLFEVPLFMGLLVATFIGLRRVDERKLSASAQPAATTFAPRPRADRPPSAGPAVNSKPPHHRRVLPCGRRPYALGKTDSATPLPEAASPRVAWMVTWTGAWVAG